MRTEVALKSITEKYVNDIFFYVFQSKWCIFFCSTCHCTCTRTFSQLFFLKNKLNESLSIQLFSFRYILYFCAFKHLRESNSCHRKLFMELNRNPWKDIFFLNFSFVLPYRGWIIKKSLWSVFVRLSVYNTCCRNSFSFTVRVYR